tara:strand:- start:220 stop:582 length:363 start_codon:yes stop_codon:yes gene_type:complete
MEVEIWTKPDLKDYWGILPVGTKRTAGWIRRQRNAPTRTYLMKIYGAQFVSEGILRGAITDCKAFSSLKDAKKFIHEYFETVSGDQERKYRGLRVRRGTSCDQKGTSCDQKGGSYDKTMP